MSLAYVLTACSDKTFSADCILSLSVTMLWMRRGPSSISLVLLPPVGMAGVAVQLAHFLDTELVLWRHLLPHAQSLIYNQVKFHIPLPAHKA